MRSAFSASNIPTSTPTFYFLATSDFLFPSYVFETDMEFIASSQLQWSRNCKLVPSRNKQLLGKVAKKYPLVGAT